MPSEIAVGLGRGKRRRAAALPARSGSPAATPGVVTFGCTGSFGLRTRRAPSSVPAATFSGTGIWKLEINRSDRGSVLLAWP